MEIPATQLLPNDDSHGNTNLNADISTSKKRIHQVGTLWIGKQKYPIFEGINKIGRNPTSDVYLTDSTVSKNHAEIEAFANSAFICDLESSNKSRLDNMILRPQRFYQIDDGTQLMFGNVNARYLFLRGFDNSILVPDTPVSSARVHRNSSITPKNLFNALTEKKDRNSNVASTQQEKNDDEEFAMLSSESQQKKIPNCSIRKQDDTTELSIHNVATQQYVQSKNDEAVCNSQTQKIPAFSIYESHESIHDLETQKSDAFNMANTNTLAQKVEKSSKKHKSSLHKLKTQILNSTDEPSGNISSKKHSTLERRAQSIHDLEMQKFDTIKESNDTSSKECDPLTDGRESIHNLETQHLDTVKNTQKNLDNSIADKSNNDEILVVESPKRHSKANFPALAIELNEYQCAMNEDVRPKSRSSNEVSRDGGSAIAEISLLNTTSNHIISETDDESETDEEGVFCNIKIDSAKKDDCKKLLHKTDQSDSETDEEGEFEAMKLDCVTRCMNSKIYNHDNKSHSSKHITNKGQAQISNELKSSNCNVRFDCQSPILANLEHLNERDTQKEVPVSHDDLFVLSTQIVHEMPNIGENNRIINSDDNDDVPTQILDNVNKQHKISSMNEEENDHGDMELIQTIEMTKNKIPVQQLSQTNDEIIELTQTIPTLETTVITGKKTQSNQSASNGIDITTVCMKFPKIVLERSSLGGKNIVRDRSKHLELSENKLTKESRIWDDQYFDDMTPTQVIDVQAAKIEVEKDLKKKEAQNVTSENILENQKERGYNSNDKSNARSQNDESPAKTSIKKPKMTLRLRKNNKTSLNDSVTENLVNLFGGESEVNYFDAQSPMATQHLQDILENTDFDANKTITLSENVNDLKLSSSTDIDSQSTYFSKLRSKKKRTAVLLSQDSAESENRDKISQSSTEGVLEMEISRFKDDVAVISEDMARVSKSKIKESQQNLELQDNVKESAMKTSAETSSEETRHTGEVDDVLAGLPEVQIYGTAFYPASPTLSVCSLDDLEEFERKRRKRLDESAAKKAQSKNKSSSKISLDDIQESTSAATSKILESSDDEELNYEELKKMAVGFIAEDTRLKKLSAKFEKMESTVDYQSISKGSIKPMLVSPTAKSRKVPQKRRGRKKNKVPQNEKNSMLSNNDRIEDSVIDVPPQKRARSLKNVTNSMSPSSNFSTESQEVQIIPEKSISEETKKRKRKLPFKLQTSETDSAHNHLTPLKSKKNGSKIINSPSAITRKINHKVLFTGIPSFNYEADVKSCGGTIVEKSEQATILVTDKIRRTNKFFCAISRHIPIVSGAWIKDSAAQKTFLDWNEYILNDPIAEAKYKFKLRESLERAREKRLFEGFVFIVTPRVTQPGFEEIKSMVQMSGGKALMRAPKLWLPDTIIISCTEDIPKVQEILLKASNEVQLRVHTVEFILLGILKQELDYTVNQIELPGN